MAGLDELVTQYAEVLRNDCGTRPDMALLRKVTLNCGPLIYDPETSMLDSSRTHDLDELRRNFLVARLGLEPGPALEEAIEAAFSVSGKPGGRQFRAVIHYLLVRHFRKQARFD